MEKITHGLRSLSQEPIASNSGSFRLPEFSSGQSQIVVRPTHRQVVSLWTCSKACAISFAVGVIVGFTLKRRLRKWAAKVLKRWKDD